MNAHIFIHEIFIGKWTETAAGVAVGKPRYYYELWVLRRCLLDGLRPHVKCPYFTPAKREILPLQATKLALDLILRWMSIAVTSFPFIEMLPSSTSFYHCTVISPSFSEIMKFKYSMRFTLDPTQIEQWVRKVMFSSQFFVVTFPWQCFWRTKSLIACTFDKSF